MLRSFVESTFSPALRRCAPWVVVVSSLCGTSAGRAQEGETESSTQLSGRSAPQWDAAFTRAQGWTGADVIGTVDLHDGRTLWLFGDTWVGAVVDGQHAPGARLVNNSIAIHRSAPHRPADPPRAEDLKFYWGPDDADGHPTAWIVPPALPAQSAETKTEARGWYWTTGGGVVVPGAGGQSQLIVFLFHVGRRGEADSVWNFENIGGALAVIDNPGDPVESWRVRQLANPHVVDAAQARQQKLKQTNWGMTALLGASDDGAAGSTVFIYGVREESPFNKQAILARVPAAQIEQFDRWEFFAGDNRWSPKAADAVAVAEHLVNEFSVERFAWSGGGDEGGKARFVMVHSEPFFGRRIFVRTSLRPEGPWSSPLPIFTVPDVKRSKDYFTYAAKGHLHLSKPGELLVSYVVNSHDFKQMVDDAFIYRPRFVTAPLDAIFHAGE
jgi:hypothetical protein